MSQSLLKGFEVEMYTGRPDGTVVGCSSEAAAAIDGIVTEPDRRNLEYITPPEASYAAQLQHLLERIRLPKDTTAWMPWVVCWFVNVRTM